MELPYPIVLMLSRLLPTTKNSVSIMTVVNVLICVSKSCYSKNLQFHLNLRNFTQFRPLSTQLFTIHSLLYTL